MKNKKRNIILISTLIIILLISLVGYFMTYLIQIDLPNQMILRQLNISDKSFSNYDISNDLIFKIERYEQSCIYGGSIGVKFCDKVYMNDGKITNSCGDCLVSCKLFEESDISGKIQLVQKNCILEDGKIGKMTCRPLLGNYIEPSLLIEDNFGVFSSCEVYNCINC